MSKGHDHLHRVGERFGWRCYFCHRPTHCQECHSEKRRQWRATRDHFVPKAAGGTAHRSNLVLACWDCNHRKADRFIKSKPRKPRDPAGCYGNRKASKPRKAFPSEHLARLMCEAVLAKHGRLLESFQCPRCSQWHVRLATTEAAVAS